MSKKPVYLTVLVIVLMGVLGVSINVHKVEATSGTIYIRANGLVEGTDKISNENNVTYTFTDHINDFIVVERSNIVIDGGGWTLDGLDFTIWEGLNLTGVSNVTIIDINIQRFASYSIYLNSVSQCVISRNTVTGSEGGIGLFSSTGIEVSDNEITGCWEAVELVSSSGNVVSGNNITDNQVAVRLWNSTDNTIAGNNMTANNFAGVTASFSSNFNTISGNNMTENIRGIYLSNSSNNPIYGNNVRNNTYGIWVIEAYNNKFYHNSFINNTKQVYDWSWDHPAYPPSINSWDDSFEGNYWSNYTGVDLNRDGIGDTEHVIDGNNTDHYPLMGPFHSFNTTLGLPVNVISNSTIESFQYFESNSTIRMYVSNMTATQTFGFCRVCVPKGLMSPPYTVIIDDGLTEVLYFNGTVYDNGTHIWIYFAYEHSTHKVDIIPEFSTWTSMLLILIVLTVVMAIYKRRLLKKPTH